MKPKSKRAPKKKEPSVKDCGCINKINELLAAKNTGINVGLTLNFETGAQGDCLQIITYKLDSKKKGRASHMLAAFCPFCGRRYGGVKQFLYAENTEGGMEEHFIRGPDELQFLRGWGNKDWKEQDAALCEFMLISRVGESHGHRLGICVRLQDYIE